jgi:hypothetical protein
MSCDNTRWNEAADAYGQSMSNLKAACEAKANAEQAVVDARAALDAAEEALASADDTLSEAETLASNRQMKMIDEAEALGVEAKLPEAGPKKVLGG